LEVTRRLASHEGIIQQVSDIAGALDDAEVLIELGVEEGDQESLDEAGSELIGLGTTMARLERETLFFGPYDDRTAIVSIHAGAGGVDAQDWAEMLFRMYLRYLERSDLSVEVDEYQVGDEAGIKSATITVSGDHAYGSFEGERGVHRLVRISPFDANSRRHTAFAGVDVIPEVDVEDIEINPEDLRIDTYRSQGAGGQHVNKTDSAVRLTHIPSGIVVECQDERSQHKNRARAMSLLKARLLDAEISQRESEQAQDRKLQVGSGDRSERIRTYNYPQGRVTDHRINLTLYKLAEVLEGDLDQVIQPLVSEYQADQLAAIN